MAPAGIATLEDGRCSTAPFDHWDLVLVWHALLRLDKCRVVAAQESVDLVLCCKLLDEAARFRRVAAVVTTNLHFGPFALLSLLQDDVHKHPKRIFYAEQHI